MRKTFGFAVLRRFFKPETREFLKVLSGKIKKLKLKTEILINFAKGFGNSTAD